MIRKPLVILESPYAARMWTSLSAEERVTFGRKSGANEGPSVADDVLAKWWAAHDLRANVAYACEALLDSIKRGEAPIASHLLYPQVLDDMKRDERELGIGCGLAWRAVADFAVFYVDRGWSKGMLAAREIYDAEGKHYEERRIR